MSKIPEILVLAAVAQAAPPVQAAPQAQATSLVSYVEEKLTLEFQGARIPAALTRPEEGDSISAILLVPGSLFLDVDGNLPIWNIFPHVYADLGRQLAARGHAVLRFAKFGPGTGSEFVDEEAANVHRRFLTRKDTARAALDLLLEKVGADVPAILAGHSEGAVVTSLLAADDARVRGVVSLSGPAVGLFDIMREQIPPGTPPEAYEKFDVAVAELRAGRPLPEGVGSDPATVMFTRVPANGLPFIVQIDAVDPAAAIAEVEVPALIVQGGRDFSVRSHHADQLAAARGDKPTESVFFPELQHMYKKVGDDVDPQAAFALDTESDPAVTTAVDAWIRRIVR